MNKKTKHIFVVSGIIAGVGVLTFIVLKSMSASPATKTASAGTTQPPANTLPQPGSAAAQTLQQVLAQGANSYNPPANNSQQVVVVNSDVTSTGTEAVPQQVSALPAANITTNANPSPFGAYGL